ncbi:MAG: AarF/ABC1/UbiB kinase family protein [Bacteroidetes bacterium]|nr:MAG: AarF/ABC1/UbiB kinase family protein [Bacteroidota bacterium]
MKYQEKITTSKTGRTLKFLGTGAKIGGNYLKHYAKKALNPALDSAELHEANAGDIYSSLSELKGSALKVAQMLSMDRGILPAAYADKFALSQYMAPPLSAPLVVRIFKKEIGKSPQELFDAFASNAKNAASIGQVHQAKLGDKTLAIKIQYPGVADSIQSDLRLVRPVALRMFNLSDKDLDKYMEEVEGKLLEETDYKLELKRGQDIARACSGIEGLRFPEYYPALSGQRILTMDWMEGEHLNEFLAKNPSQELRNTLGQRLWDFYQFQVHQLKTVHADPHPGNFLFQEDGTLGIIDFGCIKEIPRDFYFDYFGLILPEVQSKTYLLEGLMERIEMLYSYDSDEKRGVFIQAFGRMTELLSRPFATDYFDFSDKAYIEQIYSMGEEISQIPEIRDTRDGRGSKHMLYINRTYFGLYSLLHSLGAKVKTGLDDWKNEVKEKLNSLNEQP